jgi:hypothetical protein
VEEKKVLSENVLVAKSDTYSESSAKDPNPIVHLSNRIQFIHPENGYSSGEEWDERYYHILTPETQRCGEMYRYELKGYSYAMARPLWITWVGYLYADAPSQDHLIYQGHSQLSLPTDVLSLKADQYIGSNGHLYLLLGPIKQYYNSFSLNYHSGSTGERISHDKKYYKVIVSRNANPL